MHLLVTLLMTPAADSEDFRQLWLAGADEVDKVAFGRLRDLLEHLATALAEGKAHKDWPRLAAAYEAHAAFGSTPSEPASDDRADAGASPEPKIKAPAMAAPTLSAGNRPTAAPAVRPVPIASPWINEAVSRQPVGDVEATLVAEPRSEARQTLPFRSGGEPARPPSALRDQEDIVAEDVGGTAFLDSAGPSETALPFQAPPSRLQTDGNWTVEAYAQLCAECAVYPSHTDAINARHQLETSVQRARLDLGWQQRMRADPKLKARWQQAFDAYKSALARPS
jgi:hypothetical protein